MIFIFFLAYSLSGAGGPLCVSAQGFSISFDASVEELWLAWASGGALFCATPDIIHAGPALSGSHYWILRGQIRIVANKWQIVSGFWKDVIQTLLSTVLMVDTVVT